jgi:hypothetical protein
MHGLTALIAAFASTEPFLLTGALNLLVASTDRSLAWTCIGRLFLRPLFYNRCV